MWRRVWAPLAGGFAVLAFSSILTGQRSLETNANSAQLMVEHADCDYFGPQRERFIPSGLNRAGSRLRALSTTTNQVTRMIANPRASGAPMAEQEPAPGSIDSYIFADWRKNNITPAARTSDWEFIRRVTLDLTGRIPEPDRVLAFVESADRDKRTQLIDELLAKPEWVDKWTMYFGDLYHNTVTRPSTGLNRYPEGRNAFYKYIHTSLTENKPYSRMAAEMIAATTDNNYEDGVSNFILNGFMSGGPAQDTMDLMAASVFETFMGMSHVNCLICHNGRGHVDSLSLWAGGVTRYQAWQLASFFSRTNAATVRVDPAVANPQYWRIVDNRPTDYTLNTTNGNRPPRAAPTGCRSGQPCYYVPPQYIFNGDKPQPGENYREALARNVTSDFQFARATVNYLWAYFFGRGIVDPPETFDPARLDPDNPPPAPWTLQPSNAALLKALAQHFIDSGYDLKALMREITSSQTYQLSSRYDGEWNIAWEPYFARKFVRRLWAEEIHDAVAQSSATYPTYTLTGFTDRGFPPVRYAMQLPDVAGRVNDGNAANLLDAFIRGNRDDQPRKSEGSILQGLNLMNNPFVVNRTHAAGSGASMLIVWNQTRDNTDLINTLYLHILSRFPAPEEMAKAQAALPASGNARIAAIGDLVWVLYNKVDFIFNY
jgi:uncharacterized protein DUF1549/uncharacterized protein DUF1553